MLDLTGAVWRKSSRSDGNGGACVEVARNLPGIVAVRDSKDPAGNVEPLIGAVLGVTVLHEQLGPGPVVGGLLIIGSATYVTLAPSGTGKSPLAR